MVSLGFEIVFRKWKNSKSGIGEGRREREPLEAE